MNMRCLGRNTLVSSHLWRTEDYSDFTKRQAGAYGDIVGHVLVREGGRMGGCAGVMTKES